MLAEREEVFNLYDEPDKEKKIAMNDESLVVAYAHRESELGFAMIV